MRTLNRLGLLASVLGFAACAGSISGDDKSPPVLLALSTNQLTIGQPLDFIGGNFLNFTTDGHTEVRFKGTFTGQSGKTYAVDYRVRVSWADGNHVFWPFVGPYTNPFTDKTGDQIGTFEGQ